MENIFITFETFPEMQMLLGIPNSYLLNPADTNIYIYMYIPNY